MTQAEIHILIRHTLDELDVDNSHFKPDRLREFCSDAAGDIATRLPAAAMPLLQDDWIKNLGAGTQVYALPTGFVQIAGVWCNYNTAVKAMEWYPAKPIYMHNVDMLLKNSFYNPDTEHPFFLIWEHTVTIWPAPSSLSQNGLKVRWVKPHPRFSDDPAEEPLVPSYTHPWIADYGVYKCLFEDGDERFASQYKVYNAHFPEPEEGK